jgi:hypothetical protein
VTCVDERRRGKVRERGLNGIDAISVEGKTLTVIFFGTAPEYLSPANFRIEGGRRITDI